MDPRDYRETFNLNAVEADHVMRLQPKQQFLLKRPDGAKVLNLFVDEQAPPVCSRLGGGMKVMVVVISAVAALPAADKKADRPGARPRRRSPAPK